MHTTNNVWVIVSVLRNDPQHGIEERCGAFSGLDWDGIVTSSSQQGVLPLLLYALKEYSGVPERVRTRLREAYTPMAAQSLVMLDGLGRVLNAFDREGIETIVLKGAHLASTVYRHVAHRSMLDIDLLVHRDDVDKAEESLYALGYSAHQSNAEWIKNHRHIGFFHPKTGVNVEVHWSLSGETDLLEIDLPGLWERSREELVAGMRARVLCPEDLLPYLCIHLSYLHFFLPRLRGLIDLEATIHRYEDDIRWEEIERRAIEWRAPQCVFLCLQLTRDLLGSHVPEELLANLKPSDYSPALTEWAREYIFSASDNDSDEERMAWTVRDVLAARTPSRKIYDVLRRVFPPRRELARRYSVAATSHLLYLYYLWRPIHLVIRHGVFLATHGGTAWRVLRRDKATKEAAHATTLWQWLRSIR